MAQTHVFTSREEIANSVIHGIGALLSIAGLIVLIVYSAMNGTPWHVVSFTIFGVSMVILYISSTMVHALPQGKAKDIFEICDHSAIYIFIAGTYTPFIFLIIQGSLGWTLFGIVWGLAIVGTIFKVFFVKKFLFTSTILYIVMGWLVIIAWDRIIGNLHFNGVVLLVIGGVCYTIGTLFYVWRGFTYHHAVWHLFVLAGSTFHFFSILLYL